MLVDHIYEVPFANMQMKRQRWPEMPLILGRSGTLFIAMVTKLLSSKCGAHLVVKNLTAKNQTFLMQTG